jgi:hypothetical protein
MSKCTQRVQHTGREARIPQAHTSKSLQMDRGEESPYQTTNLHKKPTTCDRDHHAP